MPALGSMPQKTLAVPQRSYSWSRRATCPGCMGIEGLVSLCNTTGFSSTQTTGSRSDSGFSYILSTSSILEMYSSSNSPTHHIFFPPWLEVMAFQQNSNSLSAHAGNKFAFDHFLGQQSHRPAGTPLWRRRTDHGDNALLLLLIQTGSLARTGCIKQCALQAAIDVSSSDLPHGLGRKPEVDTHRGRGPVSYTHLRAHE